jgi:uncharacterized protein
VSSSLHPLRVNVGFLINQPLGAHRDISFDLPELHLDEDQDFQQLSGTIRVSRATQGMLVHANFKASIETQCVRCLKDFDHPLETDFDELFSFPNYPPDESGFLLPEDGNIEMQPLVREYLLLELPTKPLCKPDCRGLCEVCGGDLNFTDCGHKKTPEKKGRSEEALRWSALHELQE